MCVFFTNDLKICVKAGICRKRILPKFWESVFKICAVFSDNPRHLFVQNSRFLSSLRQIIFAAANEYYETYRIEIAMFDNAEEYLKGLLQTHFDPKKLLPIAKWKAEIEKLTAERKLLDRDYTTLKDEVKEAEQIRRSIYSIMRQEQQARKSRDAEL